MEIINPNEIGTKISTLIAESREKFYAVTPYIDISNWKKILVNLENAIKRGVCVKIFFRKIDQKNLNILSKLNIELYQIQNLHTKLYFNETEIIVSSMNFYEYSDLNSVELGIYFNDRITYDKLFGYFQKYINDVNFIYKIPKYQDNKNLIELHFFLTNRFTKARINLSDNCIFSKNLIPIFDLFIELNEITLKYPLKKINAEKIIELNDKINNKLIGRKIEMKEPNEIYSYYLWKIEVNNDNDLINLIYDLQQI